MSGAPSAELATLRVERDRLARKHAYRVEGVRLLRTEEALAMARSDSYTLSLLRPDISTMELMVTLAEDALVSVDARIRELEPALPPELQNL